MKIAIYPGTFDPITNGHLDVIKRASSLFDRLIIGVASDNASKETMFKLNERIEFIQDSVKEFDNVQVNEFEGLLMQFAESKNAIVIIRGLRVLSDFEYEFKMAMMNRGLNEKITTLFLMPHRRYVHISSSLVKEVALLGGDISDYVPSKVLDKIKLNVNDRK